MRKPTVTFSGDASLTSLGYVGTEGMIQIGGSFGGGTFTIFISLDGGTTKNAFKDLTGTAYSTTTADTFQFSLPIKDDAATGIILYGTLAGSTTPSLTVKIIDNV